ncbi:MAG: hypothetical protein OFPII_30450 [Osedax symbiont Rs1]|nr:MAG: hypothetical protein OFPII_30450 [Osedax symbiont Rs1]
MSDNSVFIIECEAKKRLEDDAVYLILVVAKVGTKLQLDGSISEALKAEGYSLVYSSDAVTADQYLQQSPQYQQQVLQLHGRVSLDNPIQFVELHLLDMKAVEAESYLSFSEQLAVASAENEAPESVQQPWIGAALKNALFAQPVESAKNTEEAPLLHTYLIVDATLRGQISGYFDLDLIQHCQVKCLFKGSAAERLKTAAPYLIDMTLTQDVFDDDSKVSKFHRDFIENHWAHNTGIVLRSYASMEEILHHYRRFTKVQNEAGEWIFFRFWDPNILIPYLTGIQHWQERVALWFNLGDGLLIDSVIAHAIDKDTLVEIMPVQSIKDITVRQPVAYTQEDFEILEVEFLRYRSKKIIAGLIIEHPNLVEINHVPLKDFLQAQIDWLHGNGFFEHSHIQNILLVTLQYQSAIEIFPQPLKSLLTDPNLTTPARARLTVKHADKLFKEVYEY